MDTGEFIFEIESRESTDTFGIVDTFGTIKPKPTSSKLAQKDKKKKPRHKHQKRNQENHSFDSNHDETDERPRKVGNDSEASKSVNGKRSDLTLSNTSGSIKSSLDDNTSPLKKKNDKREVSIDQLVSHELKRVRLKEAIIAFEEPSGKNSRQKNKTRKKDKKLPHSLTNRNITAAEQTVFEHTTAYVFPTDTSNVNERKRIENEEISEVLTSRTKMMLHQGRTLPYIVSTRNTFLRAHLL